MVLNSRDKGARGERELAAILRDMGFATARRGQQFAGGAESPDIADAIPNVHIECKRVERLQLDRAMEQSVRDAGEDLCPTVFHRKNHGEWLVTVRLKDMEWFAMNVLSDPDSVAHEKVQAEINPDPYAITKESPAFLEEE